MVREDSSVDLVDDVDDLRVVEVAFEVVYHGLVGLLCALDLLGELLAELRSVDSFLHGLDGSGLSGLVGAESSLAGSLCVLDDFACGYHAVVVEQFELVEHVLDVVVETCNTFVVELEVVPDGPVVSHQVACSGHANAQSAIIFDDRCAGTDIALLSLCGVLAVGEDHRSRVLVVGHIVTVGAVVGSVEIGELGASD